ncbi:MAG: HAMP domain-containing histidine kinase [Chloroflexi bacterium]|nr:HAMP domain-containing histidine kinase [Chloroflexota bacterium]
MNRLNLRLLAAFGGVLIVTLLIMWVTLLLVLRARPVDTDTDVLELAATWAEVRAGFPDTPEQNTRNNLAEYLSTLVAYLEDQAATRDVRIMVFQGADCVLWDSERSDSYSLRGNIERDSFLTTSEATLRSFFHGEFQDENTDTSWLYAGQPIATPLAVSAIIIRSVDAECNNQQRLTPPDLVVAKPFPEQTLRAVLETYEGSGLLLALIQAVLIGMFFALIVSFWIFRWISRPLSNLAHAATQLAHGDFSTRAPVQGPDETRLVASSFNTMAARVELSQQAQRDFLANVSHDLRTPLTSIQGFAQAITEGVAEGESARQASTIIYNEAGRLSRLVNDLLDLARIQAGRIDMMRQVVELSRLLTNVGDSLMIKARERDVEMEISVAQLPRIAGDGDRLAQVFTNLVDNAIKHTPAGGKVHLRASLDEHGGVLIEIEDTGEGIPEDDLPRIFERFYQVDKSRARRSGTGLGLAIAQEIIQAHGGHIWAESEYGQGARFNVWLPQPTHDPGETVVRQRE